MAHFVTHIMSIPPKKIHFGCVPFATKNPFVIARMVKDGKRPEKLQEPQLGNRAWNLISQCWDQDPASRPCTTAVVFILVGARLGSYPLRATSLFQF
jgi:hypothetical protein